VRLLRSLRDDGKAILMSTHDIFRAKEIADTVAIMDDGRLVMQEPAATIADQDLEALYLQYMSGQTRPAVA
jgi:ABC-2 type transport system ATP-binding protein